ncbi:PTH1R [Bugula neritina]|uniref:PTH1R n=1 Tax=Bugula neritina TaxID=10212 RepID=A0A7J7KT91_BUGNE|nr:PTH1R [Bugula neritina]
MVPSTWITNYLAIATYFLFVLGSSAKVHFYNKQQQQQNIDDARTECEEIIAEHKSAHQTNINGSCPIHFDGATCWPQTPCNTTASIQCPDYVNLFDSSETAYRYCGVDGTWSYDSDKHKYNVDYASCMEAARDLDLNSGLSAESGVADSPLIQGQLWNLRRIYIVGNTISVTALIIALVIMLLLRRLHCPRNIIHVNLFASFILRGCVQLLTEILYVNVLALPTPDQTNMADTESMISQQNEETPEYPWECKLLTSIWMYSRFSNYVWIFVEGFYLYFLIFVNTFSDKSSIKWFLMAGWCSPLLFVIPWVLVRLYFDDFGCWTNYSDAKTREYTYIISVPIIILTVIVALIIIAKSLRLAKSTLILIPLFGVHYIIFVFAQFNQVNETLELVRLYVDIFFISFQGLTVSILFCFINSEVRGEILKKWKRWHTMKNIRLPSTQPNTTTLRISIATDSESVAPSNKGDSRNSSIQSGKPVNNPQTQTTSVEEMQGLLSMDDNQNELRVKDTSQG